MSSQKELEVVDSEWEDLDHHLELTTEAITTEAIDTVEIVTVAVIDRAVV